MNDIIYKMNKFQKVCIFIISKDMDKYSGGKWDISCIQFYNLKQLILLVIKVLGIIKYLKCLKHLYLII